MKDKFNFIKIQQEDVESKISGMILTVAVSAVGLAALVLIDVFLGSDDESEQDDSDE